MKRPISAPATVVRGSIARLNARRILIGMDLWERGQSLTRSSALKVKGMNSLWQLSSRLFRAILWPQ